MNKFVIYLLAVFFSTTVFAQGGPTIRCRAINHTGYVHGLDLRALELSLFKFNGVAYVELLHGGAPLRDRLNRPLYPAQDFQQAANFGSDIDFTTSRSASERRPWGQVMIRFSPRRGDAAGFPAVVRFSEYAEVRFVCLR